MRYSITGEPMPVVICDVDANESEADAEHAAGFLRRASDG